MYEVGKAVIDTNVLIYDIFEDSIYHKEASKLLDSLNVWFIPSIVIHELVWFLRGLNISVEKAIDVVSQYVKSYKSRIVPIEIRDIIESLTIIKQEKLSLSKYNDKLILAIALRLNVPLATFDRKLRREAMKKGVKVIPSIPS